MTKRILPEHLKTKKFHGRHLFTGAVNSSLLSRMRYKRFIIICVTFCVICLRLLVVYLAHHLYPYYTAIISVVRARMQSIDVAVIDSSDMK
jgi:hypothetical protein